MSFVKFAAAKIIEAEKITLDNWRKNVIAASIKQDPKVVEASPSFDIDENGFVYVRVRAVSAMEHYGANGNGDAFPDEELQQNYKTFIRRGNYLNHQSDDISKAVGIILDAKYWTDPGTYYVECLLAVDKSEPIADKVAKGIADSVSMGAIVDRCHCSVCDKVATCEVEYCFPAGTQITLGDGTQKPIESVCVGDSVVTHRGNIRSVLKLYRRNVSEPLCKIKVEGIQAPILVTGNHPVFCSLTKDNFGFHSADSIKAGYYVVEPRLKEINEKSNLKDDFLRLLGYFVAEGSLGRQVSGKATRLDFSINAKETDIMEELRAASGKVVHVYSRKGTKGVSARIHGSDLVERVMSLVGEGAKEKRLHSDIMTLPLDKQAKFFGAWLNGDGYYDKLHDRIILVTASKYLAQQAKVIGNRIGCPTRVFEYTSPGGPSNRDKKVILQQVNIGGEGLRKLIEDTKWSLIHKERHNALSRPVKKSVKTSEDYVFRKVQSVERISYEGEVFNFEVDEDNSYVAGGIAVHNCDHLKNYMGKEYNGRKVYAINRGVNFYELSWVSVPADKDAKLLERVASQEAPNTDSRFDRMVKMADQFQSLKKEADPAPAPKENKPKPKTPFPPKKEDKDLAGIVDSVVQKEVDKGMESELVSRVRDALKKLQLKQKVQREVSDEEILQSVREELAKKTKEPVLPLESALHQAVNANLEKLDKEAEGEIIKLDDTYSVHVYGKVAGNAVAQLLKEGKATGLYTQAHTNALRNPKDGPESYYKEKFSIANEKNELNEPDNSNQVEDLQVKSNLVIRYIPHESDLSKCAFVARKGNLEVRQSASKLLSDAVQKAIVASEKKEAAGKVEHGSDYDAAKGKVDFKIQEGKEKGQPADVTKNLGGTDDAGEYDSTKGKVDLKQQEGKEPIQPSQVVQKFATQVGGKVTKLAEDKKSGVVTAEVEGGSISRIAHLWGSKASIVKEAELSHEPGSWSKEMPKPVDTTMNADKTAWSREMPDQPGKPSGSRGGEVVRYFGQYDKADLTGTPDAWARKVASLNKELIQAKAEKKMLEAALSKERTEKIAEKKASLVSEIMSRMVEAGALSPDMGEVLEWKEKGLEHDDAVAKVAALAQDRQKRELSAMDVASLEQMKKTISRFAASNNRTSEQENPKSVDVPFVGTDTSTGVSSMEDKLSAGW